MINTIFNIYDENNMPSYSDNYNIQYDTQTFDNLLDTMIQKKEKHFEYNSNEIEIK